MDQSAAPALAALELLIDRLHARGRLRVWSLVITIFGDAIAPRGGRVALATLQDVMARLRVEPGALRTAMSRLAADGWVRREREGRNAYYRLADQGRHAFDLATRRIYAAGPPQWDGSWTVAIAPPGGGRASEALVERGFLKINGGVFLRPHAPGDDMSVPDDMLVIHGESAEHPEMLRSLWPSDDVAAGYRTVIGAWQPLRDVLASGAGLSPLDAMAARTLLIHDWRRVVLRDPGLPAALLPQDWPGEAARAQVAAVYAALVPAAEEWLGGTGEASRADRQGTASRFAVAGGISGRAR